VFCLRQRNKIMSIAIAEIVFASILIFCGLGLVFFYLPSGVNCLGYLVEGIYDMILGFLILVLVALSVNKWERENA